MSPKDQEIQLAKPRHLSADIANIWDEMIPQVRPVIGEAGMEALCSQIARMRDAQRRVGAAA